jgi:hypothetical protein
MEQLSIREWNALCAMIDSFGSVKVQRYQHGDGVTTDYSNVSTVAGELICPKFNVVKIRRYDNKLGIFVDLGRGVCAWYELSEKKVFITLPADTPVLVELIA